MVSIVGFALSYAAVTAVGPLPGDAVVELCAADGAACQASIAAETPSTSGTYATPAEVDCPMPAHHNPTSGRAELVLLSGACGSQPLDFRYRISRFSDSERSSGSLRPQRGHRRAAAPATWSGLPPERGGTIFNSSPPLAIYATIMIPIPAGAHDTFERVEGGPTRTVEPPDRPPRR